MISNTQGKKGKVVREQTGNISFMLEKLKIIWSLFMSLKGKRVVLKVKFSTI